MKRTLTNQVPLPSAPEQEPGYTERLNQAVEALRADIVLEQVKTVSGQPMDPWQIAAAFVFHHGEVMVRRNQLAHYFAGSDELAQECLDAGWIQPIINRHRMVIFDINHIAACVHRVRTEGSPVKGRPPSKRTKGAKS